MVVVLDQLFALCSKKMDMKCTNLTHFYYPFSEFELLDKMLNPSGILGIMTNFLSDDSLFANWYYRRDPTHVVFYAKNDLILSHWCHNSTQF